MRLICGLFLLNGAAADPDALKAMASAMVEPGLEPRVLAWTQGSVGLACLDFARQPASTPLPIGRAGVLAADLRLDEPAALAAALGASSSAPDALLLAALERWGEDAPARVLGDYAFALWRPDEAALLCGRDALGVRPLV